MSQEGRYSVIDSCNPDFVKWAIDGRAALHFRQTGCVFCGIVTGVLIDEMHVLIGKTIVFDFSYNVIRLVKKYPEASGFKVFRDNDMMILTAHGA